MADFVKDYSGMAAAGSAFNSFADAFGKAKDDQAKRQELQARMQSEQTKAQREADMVAIQAKAAGLQKNAMSGDFEDAPLSAQGQAQQDLKAAAEGYKVQRNEQGLYGGLQVDPSSPKVIAAKNSGLRGQASAANVGTRQDNQSSAAAGKIHNDKTIIQARQQATNIDKGLETLSNPQHRPSWIEINEVAQDYANALGGAKGSSDFKLKQSEQQSFDKFMGDIAGKIKSDPDQPADQAYVEFYKKFGGRLKQSYDKQISARASNLLVGAKTSYMHNPRAFGAMQEAANLYKTGAWRDAELVGGEAAPEAQSPQGLIGQRGLIDKGLVGGAPPPTADPQIDKYAKDNGLDYAHAQAILKKRGYGR